VRRRAYIAGTLIAAILAIAAPEYCRLATSAHVFRQRFDELEKSDVNTVERLVFSLVLTKAEAPKAPPPPEISQ
jgi:hypothetical protein